MNLVGSSFPTFTLALFLFLLLSPVCVWCSVFGHEGSPGFGVNDSWRVSSRFPKTGPIKAKYKRTSLVPVRSFLPHLKLIQLELRLEFRVDTSLPLDSVSLSMEYGAARGRW